MNNYFTHLYITTVKYLGPIPDFVISANIKVCSWKGGSYVMRFIFERVTISRLLMLSAACVAMTLGGVTVFSWHTISIVGVEGPIAQEIYEAKDLLADILPPPLHALEPMVIMQSAINLGTPEAARDARKQLATWSETAIARQKIWEVSIDDSVLNTAIVKYVAPTAIKVVEVGQREVIDKIEQGDNAAAALAFQDVVGPIFAGHLAKTLDAVAKSNVYTESKITNGKTKARAEVFFLVAFASVISMMIGLSLVLFSQFTKKRLNAVTARMLAIAQGDGDLRTRIVDITGNDEAAHLVNAFNAFSKRVHDLVYEMSSTISHVLGSSTIIASSGEELSQTMRVQTKEIREIASEVSDVSKTVSQMSIFAKSATERAQAAGVAASEGSAIVKQTISDIEAIASTAKAVDAAVVSLSGRSQQIGKIINVINDIADQTNLLALNAAIEAARAGDHGRGFAVVADEVRKLADRTTNATAEIAREIEQIRQDTSSVGSRTAESLSQVNSGVERATNAGESLCSIVTQTDSVRDTIGRISNDATDQSNTVERLRERTVVVADSIGDSSQATDLIANAAIDLQSSGQVIRVMLEKFQLDRRSPASIIERHTVNNVTSSIGVVADLSMAGARIVLDRSKPTNGETLNLSITHASRSIDVTARVCWVRRKNNTNQVGLQFITVDQEAIQSIIQLARMETPVAA